jgi:hypothetical protein
LLGLAGIRQRRGRATDAGTGVGSVALFHPHLKVLRSELVAWFTGCLKAEAFIKRRQMGLSREGDGTRREVFLMEPQRFAH